MFSSVIARGAALVLAVAAVSLGMTMPAANAKSLQRPIASSPSILWPTSDVTMLTGVQVGIYGISADSAPVSVGVQDTATGNWYHTDGSWGAEARYSANIVDTAGTWRWMFTPTLAGHFVVSADSGAELQTSSFTVVAQSDPVPPPDTGTLLPPGAPNPYLHSGLGEFVAQCTPGRQANEDPIVSPGNPNFWHLHQFFGNTTTNYLSTYDSLKNQPTTCNPAVDSSAYWIPAVLDDGAPVQPTRITVYYQVSFPQNPAKVQPFPAGLKMVAGNAMARTDQSDSVVQWSCIGSSAISATIPDCGTSNLNLLVQFPDCWDGVNLDTPNHKSHMVYSAGRSCPASHPNLLPSTQYRVEFPVSGAGVTLSSDKPMMGVGQAAPGQSAHGDFINAWNQTTLTQRVTTCLQAARVCNTDGKVIR